MDKTTLLLKFPLLLSYRDEPVGEIAGMSIHGNLLFHDTAGSAVFLSYEDFAHSIAQKRRQTRNVREMVLEGLCVVIQQEKVAMEGEVRPAPPISAIRCEIILKNLCYLNSEGVGIDYDTVIEWASRRYRGSMWPPSPIDSSKVTLFPEPMRMSNGAIRAESGVSIIEFETDSDDEVLSDASTVIIDDSGGIDSEILDVFSASDISDEEEEEEEVTTMIDDIQIVASSTPHRTRRRAPECTICCEEITDVRERLMSTCRHTDHMMCRQCLIRHATNWSNHSISAMNPNSVLCPHEGCDGEFTLAFLESLVKPEDMERIMALKERFSVTGHVECPLPECGEPKIEFAKFSDNIIIWVMRFNFALRSLPTVEDLDVLDATPATVEVDSVAGDKKAIAFRLTFAESVAPAHRVRLRRSSQNISMRVLRECHEHAEEGTLHVACDRCGYVFCYHCLRPMPSDGHCLCAESEEPLRGQFNRWFTRRKGSKAESAGCCGGRGCCHHHGDKTDASAKLRRAPLMRNYELTADHCIEQLLEMSTGETVTVKCAQCLAPMHRSSACNELTHCGLRRCNVCGLSGLEGEKNLIDHYGPGRCPLYDAEGWRNLTRGMPACVEGVCHDDHHDCCRPEHAAYRATVTHARRRFMLVAALRTLPPPLLREVTRRIYALGGPLLCLLEEVMQSGLQCGQWAQR